MRVLFFNSVSSLNESVGEYLRQIGHQVCFVGKCDKEIIQMVEQAEIDFIVVNFQDVHRKHLVVFNEVIKRFGSNCPIYFIKKNSMSGNEDATEFALFKYEIFNEVMV